jgi:hypothetical protein
MVVARAEKRADGGDAIGPLAILHHHRLAPTLGQPFGDQAADQVRSTAGRERNHEPHRFLWPRLRRVNGGASMRTAAAAQSN